MSVSEALRNWDPHLAWVDFKIKVKQIAHFTVYFDQWNPLISNVIMENIHWALFKDAEVTETQNDGNSIMTSDKN